LLETFNPRVVAALARTCELLRADSAALDEQAAQLLSAARVRQKQLPTVETATTTQAAMNETEPMLPDETAPVCAPPLRVDVLRAAALAVRRRALRLWLKAGRGNLRRVTSTHVRAVERLLVGERGRRVAELPGGATVERRRGVIIFKNSDK
jgi:hypothetical protein